MTDSQQLLAAYAKDDSETAFRELVTRYIDLVYSTALRLVDGDTHRAEDVAQTVFVDLARAARTLSRGVMLGGWLHRHTCFVAANTLRGERRRQSRERQAVEMNALQHHSEADLALVAPILDETINELDEADRTAILLRFFDQRDFRSVGEALGSNEDAARMRVTRALEKLHSLLKHRGVTTSAAALGVALSANAVQAAPVGLAVTISSAAVLAGTTIQTSTAIAATKAIAMTTLQKTLITATIVVTAGAGIYEARQASILRSQVRTLQERPAALVGSEHASAAPTENGEAARLRTQNDELARENVRLKAALAASQTENGKLNSTLESERAEKKRLATEELFLGSMNQAALKALREGGANLPASLEEALAKLTSLMKASDALCEKYPHGAPAERTPEREQFVAEFKRLMEQATPLMADSHLQDALDSSDPSVVARCQLWLMAGTLDMNASQIQQADQILQQNYQDAFAQGLNWAARPEAGADAWEKARTELRAYPKTPMDVIWW